jgi:hypothetical protein
VEAPNGEEMLPRLRASLGLDRPENRRPRLVPHRAGAATTPPGCAWTTGNAVRPLVHGRTYFPVVAEALAATYTWRRGAVRRLARRFRRLGMRLRRAY